MKNHDLQDFTSYFGKFTTQLERHRRKCKTIFLLCGTVALLLVAFLPWYASDLAETLNGKTAAVAGGAWKEHASASDTVSVFIFIYAISIFLVLWPIFSYRGSNKAAGLMARDYSFKDYVYSHLLKYFGDFQFAPTGGMLASDLKGASILPPYHVYSAEDYIKGVVNDCTVKIAETEIAKIENKQRVAVFKGLLIIIDISEARVKLREPFAGKTVLIADPQKNVGPIAMKYASYQRFDLGDKRFEDKFEAYTTQTAEAQKLLSAPLIDVLLNLQEHLSQAKEQRQHFDDKIAFAAQALLDSINLPSRKRREVEKAYDESYATSLDLTKENAISMDAQYINQHVQAEFYNDKVLITLPFKNDLFETNSLFELAIHDEDKLLLFTLMQSVERITEQLNVYFEARAGSRNETYLNSKAPIPAIIAMRNSITSFARFFRSFLPPKTPNPIKKNETKEMKLNNMNIGSDVIYR